MSSNRKRKIIGVAVISGVILVSVASVGAVKLVKEANATEVNKYVTAQASSANESILTVTKTSDSGNYSSAHYEDSNGVIYTISNDTATIVGIPTSDTKIVIPSYIQILSSSSVYRVKTIGDGTNCVLKNSNPGATSYSWNVIFPKTAYVVEKNSLGDAEEKANLYFLSNNLDCYDTTLANANVYGNFYNINGTEASRIKSCYKGNIYNYSKNNNEATITSLISLGNSKLDINIPYCIVEGNNKYNVTAVSGTFDNVEEIVFPTTVTNIQGNFKNSSKAFILNKNATIGASFKEGYTKYTKNKNDDGTNSSIRITKLYMVDDNGNEVENLNTKVGYPIKNYAIYAKFEFNNEVESGPILDTNELQYNPEYISSKGTKNVTIKYSDFTQTLTFNASMLTVTYDLNGGSMDGNTSKECKYGDQIGDLPTPTKIGYKFEGWNYVGDKEGYLCTSEDTIKDDVTIKAIWTKNEEENVQTITLNDMGGTTGYLFVNGDGNVYSDGSCTNSVTLITVPTKNEYEFIGVFRDNTKIIDENGEIYTATLKGMYDANKSDYETTAKWIRKVTFDKNGGTGGTDKLYLSGSTIYSDIALTNKVSSITKPTREGCTFKGYYTTYNNTEVTIINEDGTVNTNNINIYTSTSASTALIAKWIKNEEENVSVTGVEITPTSSEIKVGGTTTITATVKPDNATNKNVTWSSSNTAVATVSNGVVTGKSEGTATITATTEDGEYTAEAQITVKNDIEDTEGPIISSVKGEKDSDGKYKVIIKVTDESGIEKILVNGTEITTKDDEGNYYFIPTQNGEYKIEAFDKVGNSTEYTYTEKNIITETKITPGKDSDGNNIIYIETITNKDVDNVKVNGKEITEKDEEGRYYFKPSGNGAYTIEVTYKDGTTENKTYNETRFTKQDGNNDKDNNGNDDNSGNNNNGGNSGNSGNGSIGNKNNLNNLNNNGSDNTSGKTGDTITTSTALTELPKTGTTMGVLFAAIASGISAIFAWFKQKRKK